MCEDLGELVTTLDEVQRKPPTLKKRILKWLRRAPDARHGYPEERRLKQSVSLPLGDYAGRTRDYIERISPGFTSSLAPGLGTAASAALSIASSLSSSIINDYEL
ncbi:hypothetical protein SCP_0805660 [Sparassis crispa]|uniref:Uncharacterized protein n=1 Tax=Sparassis crispa TaxID=139825 RepID=A0A401GV12_9APHY|nr:hypothetical protein SCP_0805660 [Sparassis crispa]GBE86042.1 hypothetical protein SCP_0805660 [Sparassis crispa]